MRFCHYCGKPMYTSNESIWIDGKNYDMHKKCKSGWKKYLDALSEDGGKK